MSVNLGLLVVVGVMAASGVYLLMERSVIRMLLGLLLVGNGINLLIVVLSGDSGSPPVRGSTTFANPEHADPLSHAMVLTAIVITMGVAAFILALVYRLFVINRDDDTLDDDVEDVKIITGTLADFPDRDRSDDPLTGADTVAGDLFDDDGNPITAQEWAELQRAVLETDLMPEDSDIIDEMTDDEDGSDEDGSDGDGDRR